MTTNPAGGDEHARNVANLFNEDLVSTLFTADERQPKRLKLKDPNKKSDSASTNWKEMAKELEAQDEARAKKSDEYHKVATGLSQLDDKDLATFPNGKPLTDDPEYVICKQCKKPILKTVATAHIKACLKAKADKKADKAKERKKLKEEAARLAMEKEQEAKDTDTKELSIEEATAAAVAGEKDEIKKGAKKTAKSGKAGTKTKKKDDLGDEEKAAAKNSKKRKATEEIKEKVPKTKKKKEKPAKAAPKPKGPVDVERQCGVELPQGGFCARSLTCKSHSMGAKRSVLGRSQPYDVLLAAYQKKNQAKQQKAAINANNPAPEDEANSLLVDSDEETESVMAAVARANPQPLVHHFPMSARRKYQHVRMAHLLGNALRPAMDPPPSASASGAISGFFSGMSYPMASPTLVSPVTGIRSGFGNTPVPAAMMRRLSAATPVG